MQFKIPDAKIEVIAEWCESRQKYAGASGGQFTYLFTPTSIGLVVEVRDNIGGEVLNVTDYDQW